MVGAIVTGLLLISTPNVDQITVPSQQEFWVAQSATDSFLTESGAEVAFLASGLLKPKIDSQGTIVSNLLFRDEPLWLVSLTGKQIIDGLEKSVAFYPLNTGSFLHVSGLEVVFAPSKPSSSRIELVTLAGSPVDPTRKYRVAMPETLAHGALGFSSIWEFQLPDKIVSPSLEKLLGQKSVQTSSARWSSKQSLSLSR